MGAVNDAKKRKRTFHWFVEPCDAATNGAMAAMLPEQDALWGKRDSEGIARNVYRVGIRELDALRKSKTQIGLDFKIYVQEGNGKMRPARFLPFIAKRRAAGTAKAAGSGER